MSMLATRSAVEFWHREFGAQKPPPELAFLEQDYAKYHDLKRHMVTWDDVMEARRKRQACELRWKREDGVVQCRALYVWVFCVPDDLIFCGWWTYLVGIGGRDYHGGGYKGNVEGKLLDDLLRLFPLVRPGNLFGDVNLEEWKAEFVKRYQRGIWCGKPQGKAPVWAEIEGGSVRKILGRAEWPKKKSA